jgi:plasmid stabilization system protein ParE
MRLRVVIAPAAKADLVAAAEWYDEREPDSLLPLELFAEFDSVVDLIAETPEAFPRYNGDVRRAILRQFPYGLYYVVEADRVVVLYFIAMAQERGPE